MSSENKHYNRVHWVKLSLIILSFIVISLGLGYLLQTYVAGLNLPLHDFGPLAYLIVFGVSIVVNVSLIPLPFAISLMVLAATLWDPLLVVLSGSIGASIGEFSHYYLGIVGKNVAIPDTMAVYTLIQRWVTQHGIWAIALLSFQPILPFEIGGFIAGAAKMPLYKFMPAMWLGRFLKYIIIIFASLGALHIIISPV